MNDSCDPPTVRCEKFDQKILDSAKNPVRPNVVADLLGLNRYFIRKRMKILVEKGLLMSHTDITDVRYFVYWRVEY